MDRAESRARFFTDFPAISCSIRDDGRLYFLGGKENPVIAEDGTIYASSIEHRLYAITPGGRKKWVFQGSVPGLPDHLVLTGSRILRTQFGWFAVSSGLATHGWPTANHDSRNTRSAEAQ